MNTAQLVTPLLENALNQYLRLDVDASSRLAEIADKVIALQITGINITLYFFPSASNVQVLADYEGEPDTIISGNPAALARLGLSKNKAHVLSEGGVQVTGDASVGTVFSNILADVEIDWEELLSKVVGDVAANQFGNIVRGVNAWAGRSRESLRMDISEYLQEEARVVPTRFEIDDFMAEVDRMRDAVERIEARLGRVQQQLTPPEKEV